MKKQVAFLFFITILGSQQDAAAQQYTATKAEYEYVPVNRQEITDSALLNFLKPYRDSVTKAMGKVIGFATATLYQKQPESPLGNFMADAMRVMGDEKFGKKIDVALVNYGISKAYIPKGEITLQQVLELMPYDNLIILQEVKGSVLRQFLDNAAVKGGWAASGLRMTVKDRRADSIFINGKLLDGQSTYTVANTDYIIRGGADNNLLLKNIPQLNIGYLYRDALTDYITSFTRKGKAVTAAIEGRIVYVD